MKAIASDVKFGPSGEASIAVIGQQLQIVFTDSNEIVNLPVTVLPPHVPSAKKLPANKKYFVSVNGKRDSLSMFNPWTGSVITKFIGFKKARNAPIPIPEQPREREGIDSRSGQSYQKDWLEFTAICEIIDAPYAGLEVRVKLRFYFGEDDEGMLGIRGTGKWSVKLTRFLEVILGDIEKVRVPWSDNPLPNLEALLLDKGKPFTIVMAKGWAEAFGETTGNVGKKSGKASAKKAAKKAAPKKKK